MRTSQTDSRRSKIKDIQFKAIAASIAAPALPKALLAPVPLERRDVDARTALLCRICAEFDEMPGTSLTLSQATRLFGLTAEILDRIFVRLIEDGALRRSTDGRYRRASDAA